MDATVMNRWLDVSGDACKTQAEDDAMVLANQLSAAVARADAFGPLRPPSEIGREVYAKALEQQPDADMRAVPSQWLLDERAVSQKMADRAEAAEAEVARLREALEAIADAPTDWRIETDKNMERLRAIAIAALEAPHD